MQKAFLLVIAAGAGIGFMWPGSDAPAPAPVAAASVAPDSAPRETVLERSPLGHFYADVEVNGQLVRFLIDTGATSVALTAKDAERIGIPFSPGEFETVGTGASGPVRGKFVTFDTVSLDGKEARSVSGAILEGADMNLLGQEYLGRFAVEMRGDTMRIY